MIDGDAAADPLKGAMIRAQTFEVTRAADAFDGGVQPKRQQHARIVGVAALMSFDGLNALQKRTEVELLDKRPDEANRMVGFDALIERLHEHFALIALGQAQTRRGRSRRNRLGRTIAWIGFGEEDRLNVRNR